MDCCFWCYGKIRSPDLLVVYLVIDITAGAGFAHCEVEVAFGVDCLVVSYNSTYIKD